MTISNEITKLQNNLSDSYTACQNKGATMPTNQNFDNLPDTIDSITGGGGNGILEQIIEDVIDGNNPVDTTDLRQAEEDIAGIIPYDISTTKTITENGTYNAVDDNANGYSSVTVNVSPVISSLTVTPSTTSQTITAPSGTDGYSPVSVSAVTSDIDSNITAGNIKKDVSILGVTGTYEGSGGSFIGLNREVVNGKYSIPTTSFTFSLPSNATDIDKFAMYYAFRNCTGLTSLDLSSLTTISSSSALYLAFYGCTSLTSVDLSSLTTVSGTQAIYSAFQGCTGLTSVDLSSLTTVSGTQAIYSAFRGCTGLTSVDLSSLTTISNSNALSSAFYGCTSLASVDLSSLTTLNSSGVMNSAFYGCTKLNTLSFPALTSSSFGSITSQFNSMLGNVTGCTVHFPRNLQSVIGNWSSVKSGFGGTNTTVLFDLPATT